MTNENENERIDVLDSSDDPSYNTKYIHNKVEDVLEASSNSVREKVVDHFVNIQVDKRVNAVIKGIEELKTLKDNAKKHKPDTTMYNREGALIHEGFSKEKLELVNKANEEIKKLESALDNAIGNNSFEKLFKHLKI
jgi:hypothetical protein